MAYLHACVGCFYAADTCDRRNDLKAAIKGLAISSLRHRCSDRRSIYLRGEGVKVLTVSDTDRGLDENGAVRDWFNATIVKQDGKKVVVFVGDGVRGEASDMLFEAASQGFVKAPLSRIKRSDHEPARIPEDT